MHCGVKCNTRLIIQPGAAFFRFDAVLVGFQFEFQRYFDRCAASRRNHQRVFIGACLGAEVCTYFNRYLCNGRTLINTVRAVNIFTCGKT